MSAVCQIVPVKGEATGKPGRSGDCVLLPLNFVAVKRSRVGAIILPLDDIKILREVILYVHPNRKVQRKTETRAPVFLDLRQCVMETRVKFYCFFVGCLLFIHALYHNTL